MTTNLERIRQMTADEVAEFMQGAHCCECLVTLNKCKKYDSAMTCKDIIKHWLEQEVEE